MVLLTKYNSGDQNENGIGGACSTYERKRGARTGFWWGNLRERGHLEHPGVDRRIILRGIFRKWNVGVRDWIDLAQDRDR